MQLKKLADDDMSFKRWPRTLGDAFGPYARLHVEPKRYNLRGWAWAIAYGMPIGALLYLVVLVRA
jgi:hypothetical protein